MDIKHVIKRILGKTPEQQIKKYGNLIETGSRVFFTEGCNFALCSEIIKQNKKCVTIGNDCIIGATFVFESDQGLISIGEKTFINNGTNIISRSRIRIGNNVTIAWGCWIYDHDSHSIYGSKRMLDVEKEIANLQNKRSMLYDKNWSNVSSKEINICDDVWIGFNCIILKGVTIGKGAVIGAGSVITKDVPPFAVVAGNPAKIVKYVYE